MRLIEYPVQPFRPLDAVRLGRFIVSKEEPQQGFKDPNCQHPHDPLITMQRDLNQSAGDSSETLFRADASAVAYYARTSGSQERQDLTTLEAKIYQLNNSDLWFKTAIQDAEIRRWVEEAMSSTGSIYMIVGYKTVRNAAMAQGQFNMRETGGSVHAPVGESLAAAALLPMAPTIADPGIESRGVHEKYAHQTLIAPDEQVVQIQLRKLKFNFLSSRDLKGAKLEGKSRWRSASNVRGLAPDVDDVVDVRLEESDDPDSQSE